MFEGKEVKVLLSQAGSGKTRRLIEEVSKELEYRRPEEIAFVTFTRKGAEEGLRRVCSKLKIDVEDLPYFRTLHSLTFHALNYKASQMFGRVEQRKFNKIYGFNLNRVEVSSRRVIPTRDTQYLDYYDLERSGALTTKQRYEADIDNEYYHQLVHAYEEFKAQQCSVDFFDCLIKYVQEGDSLPVKVAMIDEAQDITTLQWKVIEKAFENAEKIIIAGDENQSIYSYSGARPDFLIDLANTFPVEHLAVSYRIPQSVYRLAKAITEIIHDKTDKPFNPRLENPEGNIYKITDIDRLSNFLTIPKEDNKEHTAWYLLARNNCYLSRYTKLLEENLIPYWTADGFFMGGEILKRITDYENFKLEGYKSATKKHEFMKKFGISNFKYPFTETNLFTEDRKWVYNAYVETYGLEKLREMCKWNPQVLVSTIHHVKGGEADNVAIMLDATKKTRNNVFEDMDEELRILYVGVTRTKKNLYLIDSQNGEGYESIINTIKDEYNLDF